MDVFTITTATGHTISVQADCMTVDDVKVVFSNTGTTNPQAVLYQETGMFVAISGAIPPVVTPPATPPTT